MFTRRLLATAALMASVCAAHADVISISAADAQASAVSALANSAVFSSNGLASLLSTGTEAQSFLVRGVEGLYTLGSLVATSTTATSTAAAAGNTTVASGSTTVASNNTSAAGTSTSTSTSGSTVAVSAATGANVSAGIDGGLAASATAIDPVVGASAVPEPSSIALMLAGLMGAVSVARRRQQK